MRRNYVQKTLRIASKLRAKKHLEICRKFTHFAVFFAHKFDAIRIVFCELIRGVPQCFLHISLTHFPVFLEETVPENCMAILYIFQAFSWWFLWNCVQGWERRVDPGQNAAIPIGIALKNSFLQRDVNEKRDCESWPRKTVNPSFEPQPTSLMLEMRFLRRSGRKYEKSCS